ncbi:hypothetical protein DBR11_18615 [Pedobacter sp. HMWF019]|nr:hypothetical protein DBR11_18615 [Pedobacter sp. HMWF019]
MPVSYFTGIPNVEVPLYTFSEGKIAVPITLSYHASGFRPDVHPGWVGMNWSISMGGAITRTVKGLPDDFNTLERAQQTHIYLTENPDERVYNASNFGFYFNTPLLNASLWNNVDYVKQMAIANADIEPDEFSFVFPNGSGKFYLDMDGTWKVKSDRAIKVVFNGNFLAVPFQPVPGSILVGLGYSKTYAGFTIIDTDGTQYVYGGNSNFIEYSIDFVNQDKDFWQADAWYLKEIIEPSGKKVSFEYERGAFINQLTQSLSQNFGTGGSQNNFWLPPCGLSSGSFREDYTGRLNSPIYLKKIVGLTGTVNFSRLASGELDFGKDYYTNTNGATIARSIYEIIALNFRYDRNVGIAGMDNPSYFYKRLFPILYQDEQTSSNPNVPTSVSQTGVYSDLWASWLARRLEWSKLDKIEVKNNSGSIIKSFQFDYEAGVNKRLTLKSVKEGSSSGDYNTPYTFDYNLMDDVPYFSGKVDHWGFYNGVLANINDRQNTPSIYYNSRASNFTYAQQGMLNKITYPLGGFTRFEYEANSASKQLSKGRDVIESFSGDVGGIRIKKITTYDAGTPASYMVKEYFYVAGFRNSKALNSLTSSGVLGGQSQYLFKNFKVKSATSDAYYEKNQFNSLSHLPGSTNSLGSHIGYSEVVERLNNNGYTIHYFTNFDNGHMDEHETSINMAVSPYNAYSSLEEERGKAYKEENYTAGDLPVEKTESEFQALNKATQFARAIKAKSFRICPGTNDIYIEGDAYKNYTYSYLPVKITKTSYDMMGLNPVATIKHLTYDSFGQLKTESLEKSDQQTSSLTNFYAYDLGATVPYQEMTNKNIISPIVKQELYSNNVLQETLTTEYEKNLSSNTALILPKFVKTKVGNNTPEIRLEYLKYDDRGNVLSFSKNAGTKTNYIWGYGKNYPVATIEGSDYSIIENTFAMPLNDYSNYIVTPGLDNTIENYDTYLDRFRNDMAIHNCMITTYSYEPLVGITSKKDPKGMLTTYEYDSFQRLKHIKDQNGNIAKSYTYYTRPKIYPSEQISQKFYKNNCGAGAFGSEVLYTVQEGKYISLISQADANAQAYNDISQNGQAYANQQGYCTTEGTYVSLCSTGMRQVVIEDYKYTYQTYTIKVFKDPQGLYVKETPVDVQYRYNNGSINTVSVSGVKEMGEYLMEKEYVGVIPPSGEDSPSNGGEIITYWFNLVNHPNYSITTLVDCNSGPIDDGPTDDGGLKHAQNNNMVRFENLPSLCSYTAEMDKDIVVLYYYNNPQEEVKCFTGASMQSAVADGYYTFYKYGNGGPNKWYKIQQGVIIEEGTCQ